MSKNRDLTRGPVWAKLLRLAGPMVFGIVAVMSVALVDTYFVSQLGTDPLAALSFAFPVMLSITSLAIGLGAGTASLVSRAIGRGDRGEAERVTTDSLVLSMLLVVIMSVIGFVTTRPLFGLLGAEGDILILIDRYMRIWYLSMPFLVIPMVANGVIRSVGDAFWPSLMMIASAILNVILTPIFIFGWGPVPGFDIEGAAISTAIARVFTFAFALYLVIHRERLVDFAMPAMDHLMASCRRIIRIGGPAAIGNMTNPIGVTIVTAFVAWFGDTAVAGFGVASRIESMAVIPMLALSSAIGPVTGQNWGGGKRTRIISALQWSYGVCLGWSLILAAVFWLFARPLAAAFSPEQAVQEDAVRYLQVVPISLWGYGVTIVAAGCFNALGRSVTGLGIYLVRTALLYIPASWVAASLLDLHDVFTAIAISNALAGVTIAAFTLWWLSSPGARSAAEEAAA